MSKTEFRIGRRLGSFKVLIIRLRDYLGLANFIMISLMFFEGKTLHWWHYLLFLLLPVLLIIDKKVVHPEEMRATQLRSPVTKKIYETSLKMEEWLEDK